MKAKAYIVRATDYVNFHWRTFLFALMVLQACGLVCTLAVNGVMMDGDTPGYVMPALSFMHGGKMLDSTGNPILFRTPGYPFMLALIYSCTGVNSYAVVIIQMLMTMGITLMIFSVVSNFTNRATGLLASLFYVMDYVIYESACTLLTDTPFSFFVAFSAYLLVRYLKSDKMRYLLLCYVSLNVAMLIRPNIMYLNMLLFIGLLILTLIKKNAWRKTVAFFLLFIAAFGGWSMRNALNYGKPVYTTIRDDSTFMWYAPLLYAQEEKCSTEEASEYFLNAMLDKYPDYATMEPLEKTAARKDIGGGYIKSHLTGYIKMNINGLFAEMFGPRRESIKQLPIPEFLKIVFMLAVSGMLFLANLIYAVGFIVNIKRLTWLDWLLLLSTLYFMASTAVLGYSRYRLAYYPICLMGAFMCWRSKYRQAAVTTAE